MKCKKCGCMDARLVGFIYVMDEGVYEFSSVLCADCSDKKLRQFPDLAAYRKPLGNQGEKPNR